jgi:hypothetical protein
VGDFFDYKTIKVLVSVEDLVINDSGLKRGADGASAVSRFTCISRDKTRFDLNTAEISQEYFSK